MNNLVPPSLKRRGDSITATELQVHWAFTWSREVSTSWWRHQMETFSALLALCAGNSPATGEFPAKRPVTRSFYFFIDLRLNKRLSKQQWDWWFEKPSRSLWRHRNVRFESRSHNTALMNKSFEYHPGWRDNYIRAKYVYGVIITINNCTQI